MSLPPFLTDDESAGPVPTTWRDFKNPKLRKFSTPSEHVQWLDFLGYGEDGIVFKVQFGDGEPVAMKIFWLTKQPKPHVPPSGKPFIVYWAFEKEAINLAILEKITWAIKQAEDDPDETITLERNIHSQIDAINNLRAFSDEARRCPKQRRNPVEPPPVPSLTKCHGWLKIHRDDVPDVRPPVWKNVDMDMDWHWAIIYEYVPPLQQDIVVGQAHLDFFYATGFAVESYRYVNWRGGRLIDFSDLAVPLVFHNLWWVKSDNCRRDAETWFNPRECISKFRKSVLYRRPRRIRPL